MNNDNIANPNLHQTGPSSIMGDWSKIRLSDIILKTLPLWIIAGVGINELLKLAGLTITKYKKAYPEILCIGDETVYTHKKSKRRGI